MPPSHLPVPLSSSSPPSSLSTSTPPPSSANIRVYVRVRPPSAREKESATGGGGGSGGVSNACLRVDSAHNTIEVLSKPDSKHFSFDHVGDEGATQEDIFHKVGRPITDSCLQGYNGTIFAYGQTGSGKTYTIQSASGEVASSGRGLMPRVFEYLMASIAREERKPSTPSHGRIKFTVKCSFIEIYNEKIYDLLDPTSSSGSLQLREDAQRGVFVESLHEVEVQSASECEELMRRGAHQRRIGETALNRESSRSHSVFTLAIHSTQVHQPSGRTIDKQARFNLIDLAGSEVGRYRHTDGQMDQGGWYRV